ncbi:MAG: hypothetical protein JNN11_05455 [Candidatus Doudnabacteria bacterium]|nr:hypothetical protein [Candidatus Doudnabacteria bacterium]
MKIRIQEEFPTKAKKREIKKRPKQKINGRHLLLKQAHSGKKLIKF